MNLIEKQISAVQATLEQVLGEYAENKNHSQGDCLLCKEFEDYPVCDECPLTLLTSDRVACCKIAELEYTLLCDVPLEDIAGFLTSLLISLKEMKDASN